MTKDFSEIAMEHLKDGPYDTNQIRNPDRISEVLSHIEQEWRNHPDMRLGQFISVLADGQDVFGVEDTKLLGALDEELSCDYWTTIDNK